MDYSIFSTYDIRGVFGKQWDMADAQKIGRAFGTYFHQNGIQKVFLGRDNRLSGPKVLEAITAGLNKSGCDTLDMGTITTPMSYFAWYHYQAPATLMITASHNPPEYNGIKSAANKTIIYDKELQKVKEILKKEDFFSGQASNQTQPIAAAYIDYITKDINLTKPAKILIDTANGTAGLFARKIFAAVGCQVDVIFEKSDGSFPNHPAYPQKQHFYKTLKKRLREEDWDLGIAFDGDGDRLGLFLPNGSFVENDLTAAIIARDICQKNPGSKIVLNVSTTLAVLEAIENAGGEPILWQTGFPRIQAKMKEARAIFGGEISGHFFFADRYYGYDDAFYAALRLLEINDQKDFSQLVKSIPQYPKTKEYRLPLPKGKSKKAVIATIAQQFRQDHPEAKILDIDGLRFSWPEKGWGLIRASNTEPLVTLRAEGKTEKNLAEIKAIIKGYLNQHNIDINFNE